jgi:hypothetical protein
VSQPKALYLNVIGFVPKVLNNIPFGLAIDEIPGVAVGPKFQSICVLL